jgi:oxygen-independent coproporphyrinogen-3 oxidase
VVRSGLPAGPVGFLTGVGSLYIHIPFCRARCRYCSFSSFAGLESLHQRYVGAVCREIARHAGGNRIDTLFLGGGTPTVLDREHLAAIMRRCRDAFEFDQAAEISLEANPDTVRADDLNVLRKQGFNRISLGIQSFSDDELKTLGRIHDSRRARQAVADARAAGFDNLSIDLMYGLPGQTAASWRATLERALSSEPEHLSAYQLSIEEGTEFAERAGRGELLLPDEEVIAEMDEITSSLTRGAGLRHYEISNYARPGRACRHNLVYWNNEPYLGFGAGAVSYQEGVRRSRIKDPQIYCYTVEQGREPVAASERLEPIDSFKETVIMGLRLVDGVSEQRLRQRYGLGLAEVYGKTLNSLRDKGLLLFDDGHLKLSGRGRSLANLVMAELV